jgi:hypothetical protein
MLSWLLAGGVYRQEFDRDVEAHDDGKHKDVSYRGTEAFSISVPYYAVFTGKSGFKRSWHSTCVSRGTAPVIKKLELAHNGLRVSSSMQRLLCMDT